MRWLVVSPYLPHPRIGHGGGVCVYQLCRTLAVEHEVALLCFRRAGEEGLERHLEEQGVGVHTVDFLSERDRGGARVALLADRMRCHWRAWRDGEPYMVTKYRRRAMFERLAELQTDFTPDVVQIEYGFMGPYARAIRETGGSPAPHVLLNTHELVTLARLRTVANSPHSRAARGELTRWSRYESGLPGWADTVGCVTEQDRTLLHALGGAPNLRTLPLGVALDEIRAREDHESEPPRLLFVGSFGHPPNVESARTLLEEIMPRVWRSVPDVRVDVVGKAPPAVVRDAARRGGPRVNLHGFVEDLDPLFDASTLFVAPLWSGGGIKIKTLEAMARGAVVVTTPIGAEGIDDQGDSVAIAPDGGTFARAILELLDDPSRRNVLASRARKRIADHFSWAAIVGELARTVREGSRP